MLINPFTDRRARLSSSPVHTVELLHPRSSPPEEKRSVCAGGTLGTCTTCVAAPRVRILAPLPPASPSRSVGGVRFEAGQINRGGAGKSLQAGRAGRAGTVGPTSRASRLLAATNPWIYGCTHVTRCPTCDLSPFCLVASWQTEVNQAVDEDGVDRKGRRIVQVLPTPPPRRVT